MAQNLISMYRYRVVDMADGSVCETNYDNVGINLDNEIKNIK